MRTGINNFFENLDDAPTAINGLMQGKFKQGLSDTARFAINTTIGIGGILDIATALEFEKHSEDFGQTLGIWGFAEGPFLTLPFFGPQTLRSTVGLLGDSQTDPLQGLNLNSDVDQPLMLLDIVNTRAKYLAASTIAD